MHCCIYIIFNDYENSKELTCLLADKNIYQYERKTSQSENGKDYLLRNVVCLSRKVCLLPLNYKVLVYFPGKFIKSSKSLKHLLLPELL